MSVIPTQYLFGKKNHGENSRGFRPSISTRVYSVCNLQFADAMHLISGIKEGLQDLTSRLDKAASSYGVEVNADKSEILDNLETKAQINISLWT